MVMRASAILLISLAGFAAGFYTSEYRHERGLADKHRSTAGVEASALTTPAVAGDLGRELAPVLPAQASPALVNLPALNPLEQINPLLETGNYPQAAQQLEQLLAQLPSTDPQYAAVLRLLARVYEAQNRHTQAVASWFTYFQYEGDAARRQAGLQYLASYLLRLAANPLLVQERADWLMQQLNDAIRLTADNGELHLRLANMHREAQDNELAQYHALMAANQQETHVRAQTLLLAINGDASGGAQQGDEIRLALQPYGNQFLVPVVIDGISARLLLDTGASISGLTASFIERHYNLVRNTKPISLNTASGTVESYVFVVNRFSVASLDFPQHLLARLPMNNNHQFDGLLGVDILGRFDFVIDQDAAELRLRKR